MAPLTVWAVPLLELPMTPNWASRPKRLEADMGMFNAALGLRLPMPPTVGFNAAIVLALAFELYPIAELILL